MIKNKIPQKMQFRLMIDCKIDDSKYILEYVQLNFSSDFIIITDNSSLKNELNKKSDICKTIADIIPTDSVQEIESFERAYDYTMRFIEASSHIKYKKMTFFSSFINRVISELIFLEKIYFILLLFKNKNIFFCLSNWNYYHLSCIDIAECLQFEIQLPLTIKQGEIVTLDPSKIVEHRLILQSIYNINTENNKRRLLEIIKKPGSLKLSKYNKNMVLFLLTTNTYDLYLKPVYPVIGEFKKNRFPYLILTIDSRSKKILSEKKIDFIDVTDHLGDLDVKQIKVIRETIVRIKDIALKQQYSITVACLCRYLLNDAFYSEITSRCKLIKFFSEIITTLKPRSIFAMPDGTDDSEILCTLAKNHKIRTVTTIAASVTSNRRSIVHHPAEIIACYGEEAVNAYLQMGFNKNRLILTGNPFFDHIKHIDVRKIRSVLSDKLKIDFKKPVILVATSSIDKNEILWMLELIHFANIKNYDVLVKIHPGIDNDPYLKLEEYLPYRSIVDIQKMDISDLLIISDIIITDYSHVGLSAILLDKPIIVANFTGNSFPYVRYDEYGVALLATSIKELETCVEKILTDKKTQSLLKEARRNYEYYFNYKNDGKAALRIYELLTSNNDKNGFYNSLRKIM